MAHSTATTLIQSEVANLLVKPLESASVFLSMAPRVIDSAVPVRIPTLESSTGAGYVAGAASIPEDDAVFDEVEVLPSLRHGVKVIAKRSNEERRQSRFALDQIHRDRLVKDVATFVDDQIHSGDGTANAMLGIFSHQNV